MSCTLAACVNCAVNAAVISFSILFPFGWLLNKKAAGVEVNISLAFLYWIGIALHPWPFVSDIAIFVPKRDVKHQLTNWLHQSSVCICRQILECSRMKFSEIPTRLGPLLMPPDPIVINHVIMWVIPRLCVGSVLATMGEARRGVVLCDHRPIGVNRIIGILLAIISLLSWWN